MAILDLMAAEDTTTSEEDNSSVEVGPRVVVRRGVVVRQRASPPRLKNKRKSHEPKRLAHSHTNDIDTSLLAHEMKRRRLDSTGSEVGSPPSPQLTVVGQPDRVAYSRTPSPVKCAVANDQGRHHLLSPMSAPRHQLAPKKRFKLDALRDLKEEEEVRNDASTQEDAVSCSRTESGVKSPLNPFRPWSEPSEPSEPLHQPSPAESLMSRLSSCLPFLLQAGGMVLMPPELPLGLSTLPLQLAPLQLLQQHQQLQLLQPAPVQEEPLALVMEKKPVIKSEKEELDEEEKTTLPTVNSPAKMAAAAAAAFHVEQLLNSSPRHQLSSGRKRRAPSCGSNSSGSDAKSITSSPESERGRHQRNYKNLTRERRVEANARERQRVHTITAAFDTLQAAIPCEDENSKLSKLSVIKIATAYIMALSRMAGYDYTEDQSAPSLDTVVQHCQEVIHTETRIKTRKS